MKVLNKLNGGEKMKEALGFAIGMVVLTMVVMIFCLGLAQVV